MAPWAKAVAAPQRIGLWRKGLVRFENAPLRDVLMKLERYGPTGLVVHDPVVAAMTIGGSYQTDRPDIFGGYATMPAKSTPQAFFRTNPAFCGNLFEREIIFF